jgi:Mn2+/Fe2+ NRAMP family transporter
MSSEEGSMDASLATPQPAHYQRPRHQRRGIRQYFRVLGPGIVSGAADNDPSGVVTYTQIGATTGFGLLWLMAISTIVLFVIEEMSARLAICHKRGFAYVLRQRFGFRFAATSALAIPTIGNLLPGSGS